MTCACYTYVGPGKCFTCGRETTKEDWLPTTKLITPEIQSQDIINLTNAIERLIKAIDQLNTNFKAEENE